MRSRSLRLVTMPRTTDVSKAKRTEASKWDKLTLGMIPFSGCVAAAPGWGHLILPPGGDLEGVHHGQKIQQAGADQELGAVVVNVSGDIGL